MTAREIISHNLEIDKNRIIVSERNILKMLQVPPGKEDRYLKDEISFYIRKCLSIFQPAASYTLLKNVKFQNETSSCNVNGSYFSLGKIVTSALRKSLYLALFVCTCGPEIEKLSKKLLKEGNSLEGYIVDLIGSEIAECLAEMTHHKIGLDAEKEGFKYTNRYSPGYCGWPVSDQQQLFSLLMNTCGVGLTSTSLMIPIKSVSGIVGTGPDVRFQGYSCAKCDASFCIYRDKKGGMG